MVKTGGGTASIQETESFGFSQKQVLGLQSRFDSDTADMSEEMNQSAYDEFEVLEDENATIEVKNLPQYSNKKMKMSTGKNELVEMKVEGMRLDNSLKELLIEKERMMMDLSKEKIELENEKLKLEILKLQKEVYPENYEN